LRENVNVLGLACFDPAAAQHFCMITAGSGRTELDFVSERDRRWWPQDKSIPSTGRNFPTPIIMSPGNQAGELHG